MKLSLSTGLAAGVLALAAAPALAAPTVTVRVEGAAATLVDSTRVTLPDTVVKDGHQCSGASAAGALDVGTAGNWAGSWNDGFGDYFVSTIIAETPSGNDYWTVWLNHKQSGSGVCGTTAQEGDDILFFVDRCVFNGTECTEGVLPLGLTAPATATRGVATTVTVVRYSNEGKPEAVRDAHVVGPGVDTVTDAAGQAVLSFPQSGTVRIRAEKAGAARSESHAVAVSAPGAAPAPPQTVVAPDRTPPAATLAGFTDHQVFARGPRELRGSFAADPSGIRTVKLRLTKRAGGVCSYFSGRMERFRRTRCGSGAYFAIGDRAEWSYLLPARLGRGRYVLDAIAIDGAGNRTPLERGRTRVVFTVR